MTQRTILIVEDEGIVAKDLQNRLKKFGYNVPVIASSGEEAITQAAEICPDLVLMDVRLKGNIDGIEAAKHIQNHFDIPIIYLTAYADDKTLERARLTEPFGYLLKPFKGKELYTTIEIALCKHKQEKQLKDNRKQLVTAVKTIGDGVIACNHQELVTFMNPIAEQLTGYQQEEVVVGDKNLSKVFKILNIQTQKLQENPITRLIQEDIAILSSPETLLISKDGKAIPIEYRASLIKNDKGNITGAILVFRDITERKMAIEIYQKQLEQEQLLVKLAQTNQQKDDFLSTVSHELRAPLSNIKMAIQILQSTGVPEKRQQYMNILKAECEREMNLINDLLDLQRVETATTPVLNPESLEIQSWLPNIVDGFLARIQERQVTLQMNIPLDTPPLISDNASLTRILGELLNNACKYTSIGGEIVLNVCHQESEELKERETQRSEDEENLTASPSLSVIASAFNSVQVLKPPTLSTSLTIITISNSTEIPTSALPRIFEKFYRFRNPEFSKQPGTGLGLALVQKLVEKLQGTIEVESSDGWTRFILRLTNLAVSAPQPNNLI